MRAVGLHTLTYVWAHCYFIFELYTIYFYRFESLQLFYLKIVFIISGFTFTVVDAFSLSYRYLPFLVDFFYISTYFVWWGDFIFRRLLNWVRLMAVKWENKKTSPQNSAELVCWSFLLFTLSAILVLWLSPLIGKGDGGYLLYHWRIKQTGHAHATLAAEWK